MSSGIMAAAGDVPKDRFVLLVNGELDKCGPWSVDGKSGHSLAILVKGMTIKATITEEQAEAFKHLIGKQVVCYGKPKGGEKGALRLESVEDIAAAQTPRVAKAAA